MHNNYLSEAWVYSVSREGRKEGSVPSSCCLFVTRHSFLSSLLLFFSLPFTSLSLFPSLHNPSSPLFLTPITMPTMAQTQQVKDLAAARAKTTFPVLDLTRYIHGSDDKIARRRHLASLISNDPVFSNDKRHVSFSCCSCLSYKNNEE